MIDRLPAPETAREFGLRAQVETDYNQALSDWKQALRMATQPARKESYLRNWLQVSLLNPAETGSFSELQKNVQSLAEVSKPSGHTWYLAGLYAQSRGEIEVAHGYFQRVPSDSSLYFEAILARAKLELSQGDLEQTRRSLRQYFLDPNHPSNPRYWLVKAKYHEEKGSDSEAYISYSHVINHYPDHFLRSQAEQKISKLPLPKPLYPQKEPSSPRTRSERISPAGDSSDRANISPSGRFQIQAGSFRDRSRARTLKQSLVSLLDQPVKIKDTRVRGRRYYRVRVMDIHSRREASQVIEELRARGHAGYIVPP